MKYSYELYINKRTERTSKLVFLCKEMRAVLNKNISHTSINPFLENTRERKRSALFVSKRKQI